MSMGEAAAPRGHRRCADARWRQPPRLVRPDDETPRPACAPGEVTTHAAGLVHASRRSTTLNDVLDAYCIDCHSNDLKLGNLSLEGFDIGHADTARVKAEKMIRKLRAEMMPLAGRPRPPSDTLQMVATAIERVIDTASPPNRRLRARSSG